MNSTLLRHLALLLIIFCAPIHAEIYKWVDENGKLHFSDSPRENGTAEIIDLEPAVKIGTVKPQSAEHLFNKDFSKNQQNQQKRENLADKRRKEKTARVKACDDAKQDLADAILHRAGASSSSSKRYYNEKIDLAKSQKNEACKLSNFR